VKEAKPHPHLVVLSGEHKGDVIVLDDGLPVVFGARTGVRLPDPDLDPVHCQVFRADDRWFIQDFGSAKGTWLGDERVEGLRPLEFGRTFRIGATHIALLQPDAKEPARFVQQAEDALRRATEPAPPPPPPPAALAATEEDDEDELEDETTELLSAEEGGRATARRLGSATQVLDLETPPSDVGEVAEDADAAAATDEAPIDQAGPTGEAAEPASSDAAPAELRVHDSLGDYDILELLGEGTLGKVYKGYDRRRRRVVAIKVLDPGLTRDERTVARFLRGAKTGGRLSHRHIVRILAAGHAQGRIYVTMEFVEGLNLEQFCKASGGKLVPRVGLQLMNRITDALIYAHGRGVLHRNVTPENILVGQGGFPRLADLALAKRAAAGTKADLRITAQGQVLTRSLYTAPEGLLGDKLDERTDVYGVGATLFRALCDVPPYGTDPKRITQRAMTRDLEDIAKLSPGVSKPLVAMLQRCLHPDPRERFQKMRELRDAIADLPDVSE